MFFDGWSGVWRTVVVGVLAYIALVVLLRVSGKRTLSKMNAFDLVVTVALGSTLATILLSQDVALAEGTTAFAILLLLQWIVAWTSARSRAVRGLVKSEPTLLVHKGELLDEALKRKRVAPDEVMQAIRSQGYADLGKVAAVVLETDGSFSVITGETGNAAAALEGVQGWP